MGVCDRRCNLRRWAASHELDAAYACTHPCAVRDPRRGLTAFGLYEPLVELAGAGATVPLTGFGYALGKGAMEGAMENGVIGAFTGGITATAGGVAAAIVFGYLNAVIFTPRTKK